ncbi:3881_t:CDS:2 [Acaulospora morrowiae]|uniref:Mediator of RNA polymerase II transcription subunit 18 n=1 Tax=Acaulospora morrowiae TaxID=94023 RepID=A0A9N8WDX1_9GLOM|nr:3881_t:CDS:2 [Acaulospora morrowiae]
MGSNSMVTPLLFECSLHGRIPESLREKVIERLEGICGTAPINIFEHEIGFIPSVQTPDGPSRNDDLLLKLKSPIEENDLTKRQWQLCQLGHPETRSGRGVTVRSVLYAKILNGDALKFLNVLGYKYAYEYVKKGIVFTFRDLLRVNISQIFTLDKVHDVSSLKPFDEKNYIVEATTTLILAEAVDEKCQELLKFSEFLRGAVDLHHVDHLVLKNRVHYTK